MHDNLSTTISPIRLLVVEYDVWSKTRYDFHITTKEKGRNINAVRTCDPQTFELNSQGPFSHGVTHMYFPQTANFYLICTKNVMSAKSVRFVPPKNRIYGFNPLYSDGVFHTYKYSCYRLCTSRGHR